ncbi:hypothetical protein QUB70_08590, partial [Microcoleus sp. A003_D6]|uniref:hypothetical protein n=1 Tax=Microcoleus sp. A003_D6 TaxID=3055266 RepID=UPI002FD69094
LSFLFAVLTSTVNFQFDIFAKVRCTPLAEWGQAAAVEELIEFLDDVSPEFVKQTLKWAELLSLVSHLGNQKQDGKDYWQIDPVVGRLLESMAE